jgi:hypothetical protein
MPLFFERGHKNAEKTHYMTCKIKKVVLKIEPT